MSKMDQTLAFVEIHWSNSEFLGLIIGIWLGTQGLITKELGLVIVVWILVALNLEIV